MAVTLVRQTTGSSASSANATATITASTPGNLLVAFYARSGGLGTGALTGVTDSAGQTWTLATRGAVSGVANTRIECWYVASTASVTSVTFSSGTAQINSWNVLEFSGAAASAPLDVASADNSAAAAATTIATPSVTTTADGDLVLAAIHYTQTSGTLATAGFTALTDYDYTTTGSGRAAYRVGAPVGAYSASWTLGAAQAAGVITVAFKAAAGAAVAPDGLAVPVAVGSPAVDGTIAAAPDGQAAPVAVGSPSVAWTATVAPVGVTVPLAVGGPSVLGAAVTPDGVAVGVSVGSPTATWAAVVTPDGIAVPMDVGAPTAATPGGVVTRPDTGTTGRPATGTTARPYAGVTTRTTGATVRPYSGTVTRP